MRLYKPTLPMFLSGNMWIDFRGKRLDDDDTSGCWNAAFAALLQDPDEEHLPRHHLSQPCLPKKPDACANNLRDCKVNGICCTKSSSRLEKQYRLETRTDEQFRLEHQIKEVQNSTARISHRNGADRSPTSALPLRRILLEIAGEFMITVVFSTAKTCCARSLKNSTRVSIFPWSANQESANPRCYP